MSAAVEFSLEELYAEKARRELGEQLADEALRLSKDLRGFIRAGWHVLEPGNPFVPNWHIDAISEKLEAARHGEITRLLINIPPRHMKSLTVSVFWPAWRWTFDPQLKFLSASHNQDLANRDATKSRDLILSSWYQNRWPHIMLKGDVNRVSRYENTLTGYRIATHVGGGTGDGGDVLILDDPHEADEAFSEAARVRAIRWHGNTWASRFNDQRTGVEVIVMQRLHEQDMAGHLLAAQDGRWTHLCLPARYEPNHPFVWPDDPREEDGDLLWPNRIPDQALSDLAKDMTEMVAAGQLQQRPAPREGDLLKRALWRYYEREHSFYAERTVFDEAAARKFLPKFSMIVHSWDTSLKDRVKSDYAVGQTWGVRGPDMFLLRTWRNRAGLSAIVSGMLELHGWASEVWPDTPHYVLVENAATGPDAIAEISRKIQGVKSITAKGPKEMRAEAAAPALEGRNCFLPGYELEVGGGYDQATPTYVQQFVEECSTFPAGTNDDQVDAWSQAINWSRRRGTQRATMAGARGRL